MSKANGFCGMRGCSSAFLMLYGIAVAIAGWGVVASLEIYPPFAGASVSAATLVVAFGFAVSRPCLTLKVKGSPDRDFDTLSAEGDI